MAGAAITAAVLAFTVVDSTAWSPALTLPVLAGAQTGPATAAVRVAGLALARGRVVTLAGRPVAGEEVELLTWPAAALADGRRPAPGLTGPAPGPGRRAGLGAAAGARRGPVARRGQRLHGAGHPEIRA